MEVFRTLPPPPKREPCGLAVGNFDGVHLGHQAMLERLVKACTRLRIPASVLTFEPHPREYFAAQRGTVPPARISTERDKLEALAAHGVQRVCIARFDDSMASTTAEDFVADVLIEGLRTRHLLIGDDFRFGARRTGDIDTLRAFADRGAFALEPMPTVIVQGRRVSSSMVRDALAAGDFAEVERLLARPYTLSGHVVHGRKLGRTLGFPTLNLRLPFENPAVRGIFVVRVHGLAPEGLPAVASLGTRPTVEDRGHHLLEVHVFDFDREVYGEMVRVEFLSKLRDEIRFDDLGTLTDQMNRDARAARDHFAALQEQHGKGR